LRARGRAGTCLLAALLVGSCGTKEDNSLGVGFIQDQGTYKAVRYTAFAADSSTDFQTDGQPTNAGTAPVLAIGSRPGYFARSLVRFDASALPVAGTAVDSAVVLFQLDDAIGTDSTLTVRIHRVTADWGETLIAPDAFPAYLPAADSAAFPRAEAGDTVRVAVQALAQFWVDHPDSSFGVALVPADSSDLMLEYGARSSSRSPVLTVYWNDGTDVVSAEPGVTFDNTVISKTPAFVPLSGAPGRLTVGRGIPTRTLLRFPLPEVGDRGTINRALLTIHLDPAQSAFNAFRVRFQRVTAEPWQADSTAVEAVAYAIQEVSSSADSVQFELGPLVAALERHQNLGFLVRAHEDRSDTDYFRFHGPDSEDSTKVPTLRVWYTLPDEEEQP
jgi:hypothetical protein